MCGRVPITNLKRRVNEEIRVRQEMSCCDPLLMLVMVAVAIIMVMFILGFRAGFRTHVAGDELVKLGESLGFLGHKTDSDFANTTYFAAYTGSDIVLDVPNVFDGPIIGYRDFEVDKVILARFDTSHLTKFSDVTLRHVRKSLADLLSNRALHLIIYAAVGEFHHRSDRVLCTCLDYHERNEEATDRIQPSRVLHKVGTEDNSERNDAGKTVDSVVDGVGCQDRRFALACDFHGWDCQSVAVRTRRSEFDHDQG